MGKVLVPGRPSDRLSWGEAESGPIMTAMQGAKKGPTVLHKCFFFFFEASENREPPKKLILFHRNRTRRVYQGHPCTWAAGGLIPWCNAVTCQL